MQNIDGSSIESFALTHVTVWNCAPDKIACDFEFDWIESEQDLCESPYFATDDVFCHRLRQIVLNVLHKH